MGKVAVDELELLSYSDLLRIRQKAYRNGNWRKLTAFEKGFFKASLELARLRGRIVNPSLVKALKTIVSKLLQTTAVKILQRGGERVNLLLQLYSRNGVVKWLPIIKSWLKEPEYLFWLGVNQTNMVILGYL